MIQRLTDADQETCWNLIMEKPAENLFIIGDLEAFGFQTDFQEVWGDFDNHGQLRAVLLRYRENFIISSSGNYDASGFAELIRRQKRANFFVSGMAPLVDQLVGHLDSPTQSRQLFYARCDDLQKQVVVDVTVREATIADVPRIVKLHRQIFETQEGREESLTHSLQNGVARAVYIEKEGEIVSTAITAAENTRSAMIVGVATHPKYEKRGYASACMSYLCQQLLDEGKHICLFYDNPDAGKIYKRLGFRNIGVWGMHKYFQA